MRPLALLLLSSSALAAPRAFIAAGTADRAPQDRAVEARRGEAVHLYAVVRDGRRYYTNAPRLRVRGRRIPARRLRPLSAFGEVEVRWRLVEPRQHHRTTPAPNPKNPAYSNSVLFGPEHGRWLGYDTLEYVETPLPDRGPVLTVTEARPTHPRLRAHAGLGTIRYAISVETPTGTLHGPGAEAVQRGGIGPEVMRLSFRADDQLTGWLSSYFNVPNVFGSAGKGRRHQTDLHQGADCADVLVGALRKAGRRVPYTSVAGLYRHAKVLTPKLWMDADGFFAIGDTEGGGAARGAAVRLLYGADVRAGDIMVIDYAGLTATGRTWDHVGMLGADAGVPGVLDPADPLYHMGYLYGLERTPLARHGDMVVQFLRPR